MATAREIIVDFQKSYRQDRSSRDAQTYTDDSPESQLSSEFYKISKFNIEGEISSVQVADTQL